MKNIVSKIPNIETLLFSRIKPGTVLNPHRGWANLSNRILRCHLTLQTGKDNYVAVKNKKKYHKEGKIIIFDDSKLHYSSNLSNKSRIVLIIDVVRPKYVKKGNSKVKDTPELISLINNMFSQ